MRSLVAHGLSIARLALVLLAAVPAAAAPATPAPASQPAKPQGFTVIVIGDGFGDALAAGLKLDVVGQADTTILNRTRTPSGLSQDGRFQWASAIGTVLGGAGHVDAAVVMLGYDDLRPMRDGTATVAPGTPRWTQLYGDRVAALVSALRQKQVPVAWVGLPVTSDPDLSAKFAALNEITRDRAVKAGASYVDSWAAFVDENGKYSQSGPDINGQQKKMRMADGVDFTRDGARKLSSFVEPDLKRFRDQAPGPAPTQGTESGVALADQPDAPDNDVNALIRREAGLPALPSADGETRRPSEAAGPLLSLTQPALSAGGRLAEKGPPALAEIGGTLTQRALVQGQPIQPKPGRMDDFVWPRSP